MAASVNLVPDTQLRKPDISVPVSFQLACDEKRIPEEN